MVWLFTHLHNSDVHKTVQNRCTTSRLKIWKNIDHGSTFIKQREAEICKKKEANHESIGSVNNYEIKQLKSKEIQT